MKYLYLFLASMFLFSACKKSEKTKAELLEGDWKLNALTINPPQVVSGTVITDWYTQLLPCDKDNVYTFYNNATYKSDEGATKCSPSDPQNKSGNWAFLNSDTQLQLIQLQDTILYDMIDLNEQELKMNYSGRDTNNILHTYAATFGRL